MGEVYRAHDPRLGRDVALKVLPADMAGDPARLERFTREARAIAALNHPHIVTIYSTEEADGIRFLTMELVEGQPLDALIPPAGLPLARFLELALPLADALDGRASEADHASRSETGQRDGARRDGRVKVLDFGLARVAWPAADAPDHRSDAAGADHAGHHRRHDAVHVAGADRGQDARSPDGSVLARRDVPRDADGVAAVHRRVVAAADVVDSARRAGERERDPDGRARGAVPADPCAAWRSGRTIACRRRATSTTS